MTIVYVLIWLVGSVLNYLYFRFLSKKEFPYLTYSIMDRCFGIFISLGSFGSIVIIFFITKFFKLLKNFDKPAKW